MATRHISLNFGLNIVYFQENGLGKASTFTYIRGICNHYLHQISGFCNVYRSKNIIC